jgi:eukaryotic translation initiation factor 2C
MVTSLDKMIWERLQLFVAKNRFLLPKRILVYRDGVSEVTISSFICHRYFLSNDSQGQFNTVVAEELPAIRRACVKFDKPQAPYRPKLTIVICVRDL